MVFLECRNVGILPQCLRGGFLGLFKEKDTLKVTIFSFQNGTLRVAQTLLTWTGFHPLGIHVRRSHLRGNHTNMPIRL